MPTYDAGNGAFTPSTSQDNYTIDYGVTAGAFGKVIAIGWGGRLTTSTGYRTRWTRPTAAGSSTFTVLVNAYNNPNQVTVLGRVGTWGLAPTLAADPGANLWAQDWNAQGGVGMIVFPLANPWWLSNASLLSGLSCRNVAGTDANGSSYMASIEE